MCRVLTLWVFFLAGLVVLKKGVSKFKTKNHQNSPVFFNEENLFARYIEALLKSGFTIFKIMGCIKGFLLAMLEVGEFFSKYSTPPEVQHT